MPSHMNLPSSFRLDIESAVGLFAMLDDEAADEEEDDDGAWDKRYGLVDKWVRFMVVGVMHSALLLASVRPKGIFAETP